jgi:short subunit dehydrogenase-like uncharacterized protein
MRIALIGAYGFTGSLIAAELQNTGLAFTAYGRDIQKLTDLQSANTSIKEVVAIDLRTIEDVEKVMANSDLVINCAGPFTEEATLLLDKMADSGKVYLDITGEIGFVRASHEKFNDRAKVSNTLIIHGCAFESLVADLGIQIIAAKQKGINSVKTFYHFNNLRASPGTKMTMRLSKYRKTLKVANHEWAESNFQKDQWKINLSPEEENIAIPYPLPEIAYSKWNFDVNQSESFLLVGVAESKYFKGASDSKGDPMEELDVIRNKKRKGPSEEQRASQLSTIILEVLDSNNQQHLLKLVSQDMYLATAKAIVITIQKLQESGPKPKGVISPAQLFMGNEPQTLMDLDVVLSENPYFKIAANLVTV